MEINQDKLLNEMKKRIAISNFNEEQELLNLKSTRFQTWKASIKSRKKVFNIASTFAAILILVGISTSIYAKRQWVISFKEYENIEYETGYATIKDADESGYTENIEMDYIFQDDIGIKIDSLLMTDEYFEATVNLKFPEDMEINPQTLSYNFAIYDNENNVYGIFKRMNFENIEKYDTYTPYIYKEIGIDYNIFDLYSIQLCDALGATSISSENHTILSKITVDSSKGLPKSKKLFIRISNLGFYMYEENVTENFDISNKEWIFELDIPEKFYARTTRELTLKDDLEGLNIESITVSEVGLIIRGTLNGFYDMLNSVTPSEAIGLRKETIYITDENGNIYYENTSGITSNEDWFRMNFEINKNMLNQKFFLNVKIGEEIKTSELITK